MQLINIVRALPDVGRTEASMTDRDKAYLVAHNKRRMEWHAYYEKQYVPLKWSRGKFIVTRMPHANAVRLCLLILFVVQYE